VNGNIAIRNSNALKIFSDGVGLNFTNAPGAFGTLDLQKTGDLNPSVRLGHSNFPARAFTIMTGDGTGPTSERITVLPSGEVGIGTTNPGSSSLLELSSTTQGLVLPRMTKAQRNAIASPVAGMAIYQTDNTPGLRVYNGTNWMRYTETAD
jgi:hypothetical protein